MVYAILLEHAVNNREKAVEFYNAICADFDKGHTIRTAAFAGMEWATEAENLLREQSYGA